MSYCSRCDYDGWDLAFETDEEAYCYRCWPKVQKEVEERHARWAKIGHDPSSDMCGCEMCAARWDSGVFG